MQVDIPHSRASSPTITPTPTWTQTHQAQGVGHLPLFLPSLLKSVLLTKPLLQPSSPPLEGTSIAGCSHLRPSSEKADRGVGLPASFPHVAKD